MGEAAKKRLVDSGDAEARLLKHKQMVVQTKQFNNNVRIAVVFIVGFLLGTVSIAMLYRRDFSSVNSLRETVLDNKVTKPTMIKIEEPDGREVIRTKVQDVKGLGESSSPTHFARPYILPLCYIYSVKPKKLPVMKKTNSSAPPKPSMRGGNSTTSVKPKPASASNKDLSSAPKEKTNSLGINKDAIPLDSTKSIKPVPKEPPAQVQARARVPSASRPKNDEDFVKMIQSKPDDSFSTKPAVLSGALQPPTKTIKPRADAAGERVE